MLGARSLAAALRGGQLWAYSMSIRMIAPFRRATLDSPAHRFGHGLACRPLVREAHQLLGGVHIYVHLLWIYDNRERYRRVAAGR